MIKIGAFEAKTHLSSLSDKVTQGEERHTEEGSSMSEPHTRDTPVNLGTTKEIARRLVDQGRFESISEACREGLRRLDTEQRIVDRLVELGEQGIASGIAEGFDIDEFIDEMRADADSATS